MKSEMSSAENLNCISNNSGLFKLDPGVKNGPTLL